MKITQNQKEGLKKHFRGIYRFRETYAEVYDHLLAAVDHAPDIAVFENVVNQTINQDFGGYAALQKLERTKLREVNKITLNRAWEYFVNIFKPGIITLASAYGITIYYLLKNPFTAKLLVGLLGIIIVFPYILLIVWQYRSIRAMCDVKRSIQYPALKKIANVPYQIAVLSYIFFTIILGQSPFNGLDSLPHFEVVIVFTLSSLYCLSFYKWYKNEFKLQSL